MPLQQLCILLASFGSSLVILHDKTGQAIGRQFPSKDLVISRIPPKYRDSCNPVRYQSACPRRLLTNLAKLAKLRLLLPLGKRSTHQQLDQLHLVQPQYREKLP